MKMLLYNIKMQVEILLEIGIYDNQKECTETLEGLLNCYLEKKRINAHITVFTSAEELLKADWQVFQRVF